MDKLMDAARGAHTLVVVFSVAILAFAFIPDRREIYEGAMEDLRVLEKLPVVEFERYVAEQVEAARKKNAVAIEHEVQEVFTKEPRPAQAAVSPPGLGTLPSEVSFTLGQWDPGQALFTVSDGLDVKGHRVQDVVDLVSQERVTSLFIPETGFVESVLKHALDSMRPNGTLPPTIANIRLIPGAQPSAATLQFDLVQNSPVFGAPNAGRMPVTAPHAVQGRLEEVGWLSKWIKGRGVTVDRSGLPAIPSLTAVLSEVSDKSFTEAERILEDRRKEGERNFSVEGVQFPKSMVMMVAPLGLFLVVLYALAHIGQVRRALGSEAGISSWWILLFPGRLAGVLTWVSLVILPSVALGCLVWRAHGRADLFRATLFAPAALVSAIVAGFSASQLRRQAFAAAKAGSNR